MIGRICTATYQGRSHRANGTPCQDMVCAREEACVWAAAVADGAGSRGLSHIGAQQVVTAAAALLADAFDTCWDMDEQTLKTRLLTCCIASLQKTQHPLQALASTLLVCACHADGRCIWAHLGDGVIVVVQDKVQDDIQVLSHPDRGAYANETYFVTSESANAHLRLGKRILEQPCTFLLMSDGMAESLYQYHSRKPALACADIAAWVAIEDKAEVETALHHHMEAVYSHRSGDDLSLAVLAMCAVDDTDDGEVACDGIGDKIRGTARENICKRIWRAFRLRA